MSISSSAKVFNRKGALIQLCIYLFGRRAGGVKGK